MGNILVDLKRPAEAEVELRRAMELGAKVLGSTHPKVVLARSLRGVALHRLWHLDEAEGEFRAALTAFEETVGLEHHWTLLTRALLADLLRAQNRFEEAELQIRDTIAVRERLFGREHVEVARSKSVYALVLLGQRRYSEAIQYHRELLALYERLLGRANHDAEMTRVGLGVALAGEKRFAEAEKATREAISTLLRLGVPAPDEAEARYELANILRARGRHHEAKSEMQTAIGLLEREGDRSVDLSRINLAEIELELGDSAAAVQLLEPIWQKDADIPAAWRIETARLLARALAEKDPQRSESLQRMVDEHAQKR